MLSALLLTAVLDLSPHSDLAELEPNIFLRPFLEVVRSEDTTGPITGLALTSVNKFLSYGLIGKISDGFDVSVIVLVQHVCAYLSAALGLSKRCGFDWNTPKLVDMFNGCEDGNGPGDCREPRQ